MSEHEPDRDRQEQILQAILKVVGVALAIGLVIGLGTWILVKSLGLDDADTGGGPFQVEAPTRVALPTTALPQPTTAAPTPTQTPTESDTETVEPPLTPGPGDGDLYLNASPLFVGPMERINLTGQWPGKDAVSLLVQRFEDGEWVDFGVQVQVQIGTFETYVKTSHEGDNKFRVYDPDTGTASNSVVVTIN